MVKIKLWGILRNILGFEIPTQKIFLQYSPKLDFHHNDPHLAHKERGKAHYKKESRSS